MFLDIYYYYNPVKYYHEQEQGKSKHEMYNSTSIQFSLKYILKHFQMDKSLFLTIIK